MKARAGKALSKAVVNQCGVVKAQTLESKAGSIRFTASGGVGEVLLTASLDAPAPTGGNGGSITTAGAHHHYQQCANHCGCQPPQTAAMQTFT